MCRNPKCTVFTKFHKVNVPITNTQTRNRILPGPKSPFCATNRPSSKGNNDRISTSNIVDYFCLSSNFI